MPRCCRATAARRPSRRRSPPATTATGVTTMRMEAGLDSGPILLQEELAIGRRETAGELAPRLAEAGGAPAGRNPGAARARRARRRGRRTTPSRPTRRASRAAAAKPTGRSLPPCSSTACAPTPHGRGWRARCAAAGQAPLGRAGGRSRSRRRRRRSRARHHARPSRDGRLAVACGGATAFGVERLQRPGKRAARRRRLRQRRAAARPASASASRDEQAPLRAARGRPGRSRRLTPRRTAEDNVRASAAWVLERTLASLAPVDSFLESALPRFDERDQGLLRELVLGRLRWLRRLDHVIADASSRSDRRDRAGAPGAAAHRHLPAPLPRPRAAARRGARGGGAGPPAHPPRRRELRQRRAARRSRARRVWTTGRSREADPVRRLAIEQSHPDFLVERWVERFGRARTVDLLAANNRPKAMQLLAFRDRGGRELLAEALIDEGIEVEPAPLSPLGLTVRRGNPLAGAQFAAGVFYVQDEASQAAALIPPPRPGETDARRRGGARRQELRARSPGSRVRRPDPGRRLAGARRRACAPTSGGSAARCRSPSPTPGRRRSAGRSTASCSTSPAPGPARCAATPRSSGGSARARSGA